MIDGFHWTKVTSKQLRFLYEAVTLLPAPAHMYELAATIDQPLAESSPLPHQATVPATAGGLPDGLLQWEQKQLCSTELSASDDVHVTEVDRRKEPR